MRRMKLSVRSNVIRNRVDGSAVDFQEAAAFAKEAGFEAFDMSLNSAFFARADWQREADRRFELAEKAGIPIRTLHLPFDYPKTKDPLEWERFNQATFHAIDQAGRGGISCAAIHPRSYMISEYDAEEEYKAAYTFLYPFCEYAHRVGVRLGLENMRGAGQSAPARIRRFGTNVEDLIRLADELDVGICWDTGHANISMQDQYKSLIKVGKRLRLIHVNDNFGEDDVHIAPFMGNVDWDGFIRGLKEVGYQGDMNLEVTCKQMPASLWRPYTQVIAQAGRTLIDRFERA